MTQKRKITWKEVKDKVKELPKGKYWGVPKGGMYVAAMLDAVDNIEDADYIIDDLIDSGSTMRRYRTLYPDKPFIGLFDKRNGDTNWLVFPWEIEDETKEIEDYLLRIAQRLNIKINIQK